MTKHTQEIDMTGQRGFSSLVTATALTGLTALSATLAAPIAHADTVENIIVTVSRDRTKTKCPEYKYDIVLESIAQSITANSPRQGPDYRGDKEVAIGRGDPVATALTNAYVTGGGALLSDCRFTEFGVSFFRDVKAEDDTVTIVFGAPAAPPPAAPPVVLKPIPAQGPSPFGAPDQTPHPAPVQAPDPPPAAVAAPTVTATADVDRFDNPNGTGDQLPNFLMKGTTVTVKKPCRSDAFCALADGTFAYGEFLKNN